jgi:hypothetical protein
MAPDARGATEREDDVTDPRTDGSAADLAEQADLVEPPQPVLASETAPAGLDADEADAIEQQLVARPRAGGGPYRAVGDREADDADVLEQDMEVPVDDPDDDLT